MEILVCVEEILDGSVALEIREAERSVAQTEPEPIFLLGPADRAAIDLAVRMKTEATGVRRVTVATVGPERAEASLRLALAARADAAIHVCDPAAEGSDALATALILSRVARSLSFDLLLCGSGTPDAGGAAMPSALAEFLGLPQVSGVVELKFEGSELRAQQRLERGNRRLVACPLPAVVGVDASIVEPRYVSVWGLEAVRGRAVERRTLADLGISPEQVGAAAAGVQTVALAAPRVRPKKAWVPDSSMSASDRLKFITGGGVQKKSSSGFLDGSADEVASHLVDYLRKEKLI